MTSIESPLTTEDLSSDEHQLKLLLDRVLVSSTTQPLRDDLHKAIPQILEAVQTSASTGQKRVMQHVSSIQAENLQRIEAELDALLRRMRESVEDETEEVSSALTKGVDQLQTALTRFASNQNIALEVAAGRLEEVFNERTDKATSALVHAIGAVSTQIRNDSREQHLQLSGRVLELEEQLLKMSQQVLRHHEESLARNSSVSQMIDSVQTRVTSDNQTSHRLTIVVIALAAVQIACVFLFKYLL